jgi:hypothetical protein
MPSIKPRVFVAHDTLTNNFFPAKRFGEIHVCVEGHINPQDYDLALSELRSKMSDARSGDFLLPVGSPMLIAAAAVEMARRTGCLRILQWDKFSKSYEVMEVASL